MLYQQINMNKRRTVYVVFGFCLLVALVGAAVGYWLAGSTVVGIIMALVIALIYALSHDWAVNGCRDEHESSS